MRLHKTGHNTVKPRFCVLGDFTVEDEGGGGTGDSTEDADGLDHRASEDEDERSDEPTAEEEGADESSSSYSHTQIR